MERSSSSNGLVVQSKVSLTRHTPDGFAAGTCLTLGEAGRGERLIAIPDALFKLVTREADGGGEVEVPGFIYPQEDGTYGRKPYRHEGYLARVDSIEALTGLDLLIGVGERVQRKVESVRPERLWPVEGRYFTEGCKGSRRHVAALGR